MKPRGLIIVRELEVYFKIISIVLDILVGRRTFCAEKRPFCGHRWTKIAKREKAKNFIANSPHYHHGVPIPLAIRQLIYIRKYL
jgi:hypothetical protein